MYVIISTTNFPVQLEAVFRECHWLMLQLSSRSMQMFLQRISVTSWALPSGVRTGSCEALNTELMDVIYEVFKVRCWDNIHITGKKRYRYDRKMSELWWSLFPRYMAQALRVNRGGEGITRVPMVLAFGSGYTVSNFFLPLERFY